MCWSSVLFRRRPLRRPHEATLIRHASARLDYRGIMGKTNNNKILILAALLVVFFGTVVFVSAQDPRLIGGTGITVFADSNFRGTAQTFQYDMADLRSTGLDNRI